MHGAWPALASGRWSIVDCFDADGTSHVVARADAPDLGGLRALAGREREVVERVALGLSRKAIAHELGIAAPTVSTLLHGALRKLGLPGVARLGTLVRGLLRPPPLQ